MNEIIVGNIGCVYRGADDDIAREKYDEYVEQSKSQRGRAGGEDVTWMRDGEIVDGFVGELNRAIE